MTLAERLRQLAAALPSEASSVTLTRRDILAMLEGAADAVSSRPGRDMTVEEVAEEVQRSPSTIRRWLIAGELRGYKLQGRDWRVTRPALRDYLARQARPDDESPKDSPEVDISAWRSLAEPGPQEKSPRGGCRSR